MDLSSDFHHFTPRNSFPYKSNKSGSGNHLLNVQEGLKEGKEFIRALQLCFLKNQTVVVIDRTPASSVIYIISYHIISYYMIYNYELNTIYHRSYCIILYHIVVYYILTCLYYDCHVYNLSKQLCMYQLFFLYQM